MKALLIFLAAFSTCFSNEEWPQRPMLFGFAVEGYPITAKQLNELQVETGVTPQIIVFYLQWSQTLTENSLTSSLKDIALTGAIPCLTWEPMTLNAGNEQMIPYKEILEGRYDAYIDQVADQFKNSRVSCIMRFAHEMNISRYHWGTDAQNYGEQSPEIYRKMYQYVFNRFKQKQVQNVYWAFCPNVDAVPDAPWNKPANYYPGDDYVSLFGMDGYNWAIDADIAKKRGISWTSPWKSFETIFGPLYAQLKEISKSKPIIVFETASAERPGHPSKKEWLEEAKKIAQKWDLQGIVWFHANKEEDWKLKSVIVN